MAALHFVILLLLPIAAFGQATLRPSQEMSMELFRDVDRDGDGQVTREEVNLYYQGYDHNGDGHITQQEFSQYIFTHYPDLQSYSAKLYAFFDFNNDRVLTHTDFEYLFTQIDSTNNGFVSQAEFVKYFNVIFDSLGTARLIHL